MKIKPTNDHWELVHTWSALGARSIGVVQDGDRLVFVVRAFQMGGRPKIKPDEFIIRINQEYRIEAKPTRFELYVKMVKD